MRHVHTLTQEYCCQHWVLSTQGGLSMSAICWNIGESPCTDVLHIIRTPWQCVLDTFNSTCLAFMCVHSYARMSACVGGWLCRMCTHVCASICPYNVKIPAAKDHCFRSGPRCWFEWQGSGHHWRQWWTWLWDGPCYCRSRSTCRIGLQRCSEGRSSSAENPLEARTYVHRRIICFMA